MKSHNHQGPSVDTGLGLRAVRESLPQAAPWFMEGLLTMSRSSFTGRVLPQPLLPSPQGILLCVFGSEFLILLVQYLNWTRDTPFL